MQVKGQVHRLLDIADEECRAGDGSIEIFADMHHFEIPIAVSLEKDLGILARQLLFEHVRPELKEPAHHLLIFALDNQKARSRIWAEFYAQNCAAARQPVE